MSGNSSGRNSAAEITGVASGVRRPHCHLHSGKVSRSFRKFTSEREDSRRKLSEGPEGGRGGEQKVRATERCERCGRGHLYHRDETQSRRHRLNEARVRGAGPAPSADVTTHSPRGFHCRQTPGTCEGLFLARARHLSPGSPSSPSHITWRINHGFFFSAFYCFAI